MKATASSSPSGTAPPAERETDRDRRAPRLSLAAWQQFMQVARPYWKGDQKRTAWGLLGLLIALMLFETHLAVQLNDRTGEMTSALAAQDRTRFWAAVQSSLWVIAFAVPVFAFYYYMRDAFSNHWRRWLTHHFLDGYLQGRRYYELDKSGRLDNPDQRISEDINAFTGRSTHFTLVLLGSLMQLVAFSAVLWSLSKVLVGFLAVYAFVGTFVALYVFGQPLIQLNFWQLRREADFRFSLMRLRENAESIAFYRGEAQERERIERDFDAVYRNYDALIRKQRSLNIYQRAFSQLTLVIPAVILANAVLSGELEVGRAVQAAGAFAAVLGAVSLIVDNFESLSRFVAGIGRLHTLSAAVTAWAPDGPIPPPSPQDPVAPAGSESVAHPEWSVDGIRTVWGPALAVEGLTLCTPRLERLLVRDLNLELAAGDGLLITGVSGCGKSSLLRAIAGLWRSGCGVVRHPELEQVFFLPQRPYMQEGTLRSQLIYPSSRTDLDDGDLQQMLDRVQLPQLCDRFGGLDTVRDWGKVLSIGEQQRLAFARVLVARPHIVILDEATSALDSANEAALYAHLRHQGCTLVSVAHRSALLRHHTQVLHLKGEGAWEIVPAERFSFDEHD